MVDVEKGGDVRPPHQQLKDARICQSKTCEDVAAALNIPVATIKTLELGQFEKLHGEAFVTGYMRAYATFLAFPPAQSQQLIQQYLLQSRAINAVEQYQEPAMYSARLSQSFQHKENKTAYGLAAAMTLVVMMGIFSVDEADKPQPAIASDDIHLQTEAGTTVITSVQKLPQDNPTQDILPIVTVEEVDVVLSAGSLAELPSATLKSHLSFQFSAPCWVEILDGDGKSIYASLQKSQQKLQLSGKPPFRITLGYAPGVELSYNGQPVDLNAEKADLVKLVLGNS
ncbi:MAG: helix-turn-helix domain-containing protein [Pseudomonadales bacterium]|nr:helix-turn-helix domain-containing protein [Pseudomonadales bacterium]